MKVIRRFLILSHRYLGIALSLLVMVWFASGIVMMYAGAMPALTPELRLERLADLEVADVRITPAQAVDAALTYGAEVRGRLLLQTVMDRPAYRVGVTTVFADTGEVLEQLDAAAARSVAARFMRVSADQIQFTETLEETDQWTLGQARVLPLHRFDVADAASTRVYVQADTGEVALLTTRQSRTLAWLGAIPHWLYFEGLRSNQPLWYRVVMWTSIVTCVVTVLGLLLGVTQLRKTRPFHLARAIPYSGWMRWHYITGVVFGLFTLTWAFSGMLSLEPFEWSNARGLTAPRDALTGGPADPAAFGMPDAATWSRVLDGQGIKEIEFTRIHDVHYFAVRTAPREPQADGRRERLHQPYAVRGRGVGERVLVAADTLQARHAPFGPDEILGRLRTALPDERILEASLLSEYDSYYYSRRREAPLPVLRVKFDDPGQTWFYIDPAASRVLAEVHAYNRIERWLYNGLHSLDFSFWYDRRPLWDIGMILLLLGGLASSSIGFFFGVRRLWRGARRMAT